MNKLPIFHDPSGQRWRWISSASLVLGIVVTTLLASFTINILTTPLRGFLSIKPGHGLLKAINIDTVEAKISEKHLAKSSIATYKKLAPPSSPPLSIGFYVNWDDSSYASLAKNIHQLDWLIPEWLHLTAGDEPLKYDIDKKVIALVKSKNPSLKILPLINNFDKNDWQSEPLTHWMHKVESRTLLINKLTNFVQENGFDGITIDFENVPKTSQVDLLTFMSELHKVFAAR